MGVGVAGFLPMSDWQDLVQSQQGCNGDCPQLAVGQIMFGKTGFYLMALGSVLATLSSMVVILAAMPRLLYGMVRDEGNSTGFSAWIKHLDPITHAPINATLLTFSIYLITSLYGDKVTEWIFSAAYVWLIIYMWYHLLRAIDITKRNKSLRLLWIPILGFAATGSVLYYAFAGTHQFYGFRALTILIIAGLGTIMLKGKINTAYRVLFSAIKK